MAVGPGGTIIPNSPMVKWKYIGQSETTGVGPDGKATQGVQVSFMLDGEGPYSVFLPRAMYSVNNVNAAIQAYAAHLNAVKQAGS